MVWRKVEARRSEVSKRISREKYCGYTRVLNEAAAVDSLGCNTRNMKDNVARVQNEAKLAE